MLILMIVSSFHNSATPISNEFTDSRDSNTYETVEVGHLKWLKENLRYKVNASMCLSDISDEKCADCGEFYLVEDALKICPENWRLPTEEEIKRLLKSNKRKKINLAKALNIELCGRIDNGKSAKYGLQNTFWIDAPLENGYITHWHTFGKKHELHSHNVVNAKRQFPVRCVCEIENN